MKHLCLLALFAVAIYGLTGCASTKDSASTGDPVPGERTSEEARLAPGGGPGSASVKW